MGPRAVCIPAAARPPAAQDPAAGERPKSSRRRRHGDVPTLDSARTRREPPCIRPERPGVMAAFPHDEHERPPGPESTWCRNAPRRAGPIRCRPPGTTHCLATRDELRGCPKQEAPDRVAARASALISFGASSSPAQAHSDLLPSLILEGRSHDRTSLCFSNLSRPIVPGDRTRIQLLPPPAAVRPPAPRHAGERLSHDGVRKQTPG